jgi:predicted nuclease of predicted toxin-antitoxin system
MFGILLDENLSPTLVQRLAEKGIAAQHVVHIGLSGKTDPQVWKHAFEHDQVVVTITPATSSAWPLPSSCIPG